MLFSDNYKENHKINKRKIGFVLGQTLYECNYKTWIKEAANK